MFIQSFLYQTIPSYDQNRTLTKIWGSSLYYINDINQSMHEWCRHRQCMVDKGPPARKSLFDRRNSWNLNHSVKYFRAGKINKTICGYFITFNHMKSENLKQFKIYSYLKLAWAHSFLARSIDMSSSNKAF